MRCTILPRDIDVRVWRRCLDKLDRCKIPFYFCLPDGEIFLISIKYDAKGKYEYYEEIEHYGKFCFSAQKTFFSHDKVEWLFLPVDVRKKIWLYLIREQTNSPYDEEEANFVYYGESEDYIWAATHQIYSIEITMRVIKKYGRFNTCRYIGCKHFYNTEKVNSFQYLIDDKKLVTVHVSARSVSCEIRSWERMLAQEKKHEQWIANVAKRAIVPREIAILLSPKIKDEEKAIEILKAVRDQRLQIQMRLNDEENHPYFILNRLEKAVNSDLLCKFDLSEMEAPQKLYDYFMK